MLHIWFKTIYLCIYEVITTNIIREKHVTMIMMIIKKVKFVLNVCTLMTYQIIVNKTKYIFEKKNQKIMTVRKIFFSEKEKHCVEQLLMPNTFVYV